ncbi:hypothetical protein RJ640_003087 [Escallonia rubra]|uniref:Uncharacterized protein n=1 Tax=Escallonia rubra TaxID=112253 RepID=A0AA88RZ30_9ASTE|nr:hypothetical protein RJ640_003087 [Escallonia rubra]
MLCILRRPIRWCLLLSRPPSLSFQKQQRNLHNDVLLPSSNVPTTATVVLLSSLLRRCSCLDHVHQTHAFMVPKGLDQDNLLLSRFIDACSASGFLDYAYSVFSHKSLPDIFLYNTMIKALSRHLPGLDYAKEAVFLYNQARVIGLQIDSYSFPFALKAVVRLSAVALGREIHCQALCSGLDTNVHVAAALIQMYSSCTCVEDARKVFDEMPLRDVVSWNAMVAGYVKVGDMDSAMEVFGRMPERNVISWTAVIAGYAQANRPSEAIFVFRRMQLDGVHPDEVSMLAALSACAHLGALELGEWIHSYTDKHGLRKTVSLNNALIDMYAKSGNINKAVDIFENMEHKTVITWTTIIVGLALHGLGREALQMFSRMVRARIRPNDVTFIGILSACSHVGLVEMGRWFFNAMGSRYGIKPRIEHYGCMTDLLGRAGCLQEAQELIRGMPFEANAAIWGSLLAASRIRGDTELGERALQHLIKLEPHNSGNYSLLSNMYTAHGSWNEAGNTRTVMRNIGVKKMPGGSCIEVDKAVHEFKAGDRSHPQSDRIYMLVSQINGGLKMAGYDHGQSWELLDFATFQQDIV